MSQLQTDTDAVTAKQNHKLVSKKAISAPQVLNEAYCYDRPSSFSRGMRLSNCRTEREIRTNNAVSFLSQQREIVDEAYAGDIIGLPNHGTIRLGDTLTEGERLQFTGLPFFAPEQFRRAELVTPMKTKQLRAGLERGHDRHAAPAHVRGPPLQRHRRDQRRPIQRQR